MLPEIKLYLYEHSVLWLSIYNPIMQSLFVFFWRPVSLEGLGPGCAVVLLFAPTLARDGHGGFNTQLRNN